MKLNKKNAIAIYKDNRITGGPRYTYYFKCLVDDCEEIIKVRNDALNKNTGLCHSHVQRKRPFERIIFSVAFSFLFV